MIMSFTAFYICAIFSFISVFANLIFFPLFFFFLFLFLPYFTLQYTHGGFMSVFANFKKLVYVEFNYVISRNQSSELRRDIGKTEKLERRCEVFVLLKS